MLTHQEWEEQYSLKTACKSVKQTSTAWISQIIEPQSITNIKRIWPLRGCAKERKWELTWNLETVRNISKGNHLGGSVNPTPRPRAKCCLWTSGPGTQLTKVAILRWGWGVPKLLKSQPTWQGSSRGIDTEGLLYASR